MLTMSTADGFEATPRTGPPQAISTGASSATALLEKAIQAGARDPSVPYLLALAYKRQGKIEEARAALRKITPPDADVFLQLGLLSLREGQPAQAEQEFARAWELDSASYEICHNLLLTRLTLNQVEAAAALLPRAVELAATADERRFLGLLHAMLRSGQGNNGDHRFDPDLLEVSPEDEQRLLALVRSLGQIDTTLALIKILALARPRSAQIQEAYLEVALAKAKELFDRCAWIEAMQCLEPLVREKPPVSGAARPTLAALFNLLGCAACLSQDFERGIDYFSAALKLAPKDARIHQNLALAHELDGRLADAEPHWDNFFDLIDNRLPAPPGRKDYHDQLIYEGLNRLAGCFTDRERWNRALDYVQRAARLRPGDTDTLERLFHLYNHAKRPEEARKVLRRLREMRPGEPQYDLYELDLVEVKNLHDIERMLTEIDRILKRHPNDARVEERAVAMVGNVVPMMGNLCDQLTEQMSKVIDQVRSLPNYQINWSAVHEVMRDLIKEFQRLRRITSKCLPLVTNDEHRRIVRELTEHIDRKIEVCRSMGA
jgi:tetratricopeptide (TPR) repeat protein